MPDLRSLPRELLTGAHSRKALLAAGITPYELIGPLWERLDQGRYAWAPSSPPTTMDRIRRVLPLLPDGGVVGGWAAAVVHGVEGLDGESWTAQSLPVQVAISRHQTCRRTAGVKVFRSDLDPVDLAVIGGIPVTSLERTALDIARLDLMTLRVAQSRADLEESVVWLDAMVRDADLDLSVCLGYLEERRHRIGIKQARRVLDLVDGRSASPQESRFRLLWQLDAGLDRPLVNVEIFDAQGRLVAVADLLDEESGLVGEYDGAFHASAKRRSRDLVRAERMGGLGLCVVRVTSEDLTHHRTQTVQRLRTARTLALGMVERASYRLGGYQKVS